MQGSVRTVAERIREGISEELCDRDWSEFIHRYEAREWRSPIFRDMVLTDIRRMRAPVVLDIGCGRGFDDEPSLQGSLAEFAREYIGIEPDREMAVSPVLTQVHRSCFEDAPLSPESVDLAYSVMVLEHVEAPQEFWNKLWSVLRPGGVFWGFTVDARHHFARLSHLATRIGLKDIYLNHLVGRKGQDRYENYPTFYRSNSPDEVNRLAAAFRLRTTLNFHRVGQLDFYFPPALRWCAHLWDRWVLSRGLPGSILVVRAVK